MSPEPHTTDPLGPGASEGEPPTAPAYALVGPDGGLLEATEVFGRLIGANALQTPAVGSAIFAVLSGDRDSTDLHVADEDGARFAMSVEAMRDDRGRRLALVETHVPRPLDGAEAAAAWFPIFAADSEAIVWLKDLDGRFVWVNAAYSTALGVQPEAIRGRTDAELSLEQAIDGPRLRAAGRPAASAEPSEPLSLEYTIPGFDQRPAFAALRFPLRDAAGEPLLVCGVASPLERGDLAQRECAALLKVIRWSRGEARQIRQDVLTGWGLTPSEPAEGRGVDPSSSAQSPPATDRSQVVSAPGRPAGGSGPAAPPAWAPAAVNTAISSHPAPPARDPAAGPSSAQADAVPAHIRINKLNAELSAARGEVADREAALASARAELARLERALADAVAAATGRPANDGTTQVGPGPGSGSTLSGGPGAEAAADIRPGWGPPAHAVLQEALAGCLNLRSIFSEAVRCIGAAGGWDLAAAWLPEASESKFFCATTWLRSAEEMSSAETALRQAPRNAATSTLATAAATGQAAWVTDLASGADAHLQGLHAAGIGTVVLMPISPGGRNLAVLELCSRHHQAASAPADAALRSITTEIETATQRLAGSEAPRPAERSDR